MAFKEICNRVLAETGFPQFSSIASNADAGAQQILAIANTQLRLMSQKHEWPQLEVEYSFDTVASQAQYAWPADFRKLVVGSVFDTEQYYRVRGSTTIEQWNSYKYGLLGSLSHQRFRQVYVAGVPTIELTPAPTDARSLVALYMTNEYARNAAGVSQAEYVLDTDVSKVPEHIVEIGIKWRFRRAKGLDYSVEIAEYESMIRQQFAGAAALGDIPIGGYALDDGITSGYVPDNGFGT